MINNISRFQDATGTYYQISPLKIPLFWSPADEPETHSTGDHCQGQKKTLCLYSSSFHFPCFQIISYDSPRGGVSVITEKGDVVTSSHLVVQKAKPSDSGNYSCAPSIGQRVAVNVHVLRGKSSRFHLTGCENFNKRKIKVCVSSVLGPLRLAYDI